MSKRRKERKLDITRAKKKDCEKDRKKIMYPSEKDTYTHMYNVANDCNLVYMVCGRILEGNRGVEKMTQMKLELW